MTASTELSDGGKARILIVEDDPETRNQTFPEIRAPQATVIAAFRQLFNGSGPYTHEDREYP